MRVDRLGHVNIRTPAFADTIAFYEAVLGLRAGPAASANARLQNVWLYDEAGDAIIHVHPEGAASRFDHFALDCSGLDSCIARLDEQGISFERFRIEARGLTQLNITDPNGLKVELTFSDRTEGPQERA
jgi:catechol 2,3-dioxygenase-like lactoylglutathione lyase family enzyme